MTPKISRSLRRLVSSRAGFRCEYCLLHESCVLGSHQADHVVARKHGGTTNGENLALACAFCNGRKGTDISSIDPISRRRVHLFDPRQDRWSRHFRLRGAVIVPLTTKGRATAHLLQFNAVENVEFRRVLIAQGLYP